MARAPFYAQFDGDEYSGTRYALGDPIDEKLDDGTIAYLVAEGRIGATKPLPITTPIDGSERPDVAGMTRAELLAELGNGQDNDILRDAVTRKRENDDDTDEDDDTTNEPDDEAYADLKDKPLATLKTAELLIVAEAEGVEFGEEVNTNPKRVEAIQHKRDAAA